MSETSEPIKKNEKVEAPAKKQEDKIFLFPHEGVSIKAKNREEAEKLYKQSVKETKESNND